MGCPGGLTLLCKLIPQPQASARGSVGSSADELCPCSVGHRSCASQPLCQALVCPQTADRLPYEDSVCSSSCVRPLGYEYCIGFTEECLNTASNCECSPKEGKRGCLTSPVTLAGMPAGTGLHYKAREQTSKEVPDGAATACSETTGKTPNKERSKRSETRSRHSTLWSETSLSAACAVQDGLGCDGAMERVRAAEQRLQTGAPHACDTSFHIAFPVNGTIKQQWCFSQGSLIIHYRICIISVSLSPEEQDSVM